MTNLNRGYAWGISVPPIDASINWGHPIAQDMIFCHLPHRTARNLVNGKVVTAAIGSPAAAAGRTQGVRTDGSSSVGWSYGDLGGTNFSAAFSAMVWVWSAAFSDSPNPVALARDSNTLGRGFAIDLHSTGHRFYCNGGTGGALASGVAPVTNKMYQVLGVYKSGSGNSRLYTDGVLRTSGTTGAPTSNTANLWVGRRDYASNQGYINGGVGLAVLWSRIIRPEEVAWLYAEPYCFLQNPGF